MVTMLSALVSLAVVFLCFSTGIEASTTVTIVTTSSTTTTTTKTEPTSSDETPTQPAPQKCPSVPPESGSTSNEVRGNQEKFLHLSVDPVTITEGVTSQLTINCSFSASFKADVALVKMMSVFRFRESSSGPEKQELYAAHAGSKNKPNTGDGEILTNITHNGLSYINITINNPTSKDEGLYRCSVLGVDNRKEPFLGTASNDVRVHGSSRPTRNSEPVMADSPAETPESIEALLRQLEVLQKSMETITPSVTALENFRRHFDARLDNARQTLFPYTMSNISALYLISSENYTHSKIAQATCELFGGHLAESDTLDEYNFMKTFIERISDDSQFLDAAGVLIGGTDEVDEGQWRTKYNASKLPFLFWDNRYPNKDMLTNCIVMSRVAGWKMRDVPCEATQFHVRFMCEIPFAQ